VLVWDVVPCITVKVTDVWEKYFFHARYEAFIALMLRILVFWNATDCIG
jgi:hypothetical protein